MHLLLQQHLPHLHTLAHILRDTHLLTFSVHHFAVAMPRAHCPGTAESLELHTTCWFFRSPSVAHTNIFSSLLLSVLTPSLLLSVLRTQTHSLSPLHTHTEFSPPLPPSRTYCLDRGRSFYQQGYFTLRLWLIRGGVEVDDEAVEEQEEVAGGVRRER